MKASMKAEDVEMLMVSESCVIVDRASEDENEWQTKNFILMKSLTKIQKDLMSDSKINSDKLLLLIIKVWFKLSTEKIFFGKNYCGQNRLFSE